MYFIINRLMPNDFPILTHWKNQLPIFGVLRCISRFIQILIENSLANSGDPDQTPRSVASDLGLHRLPMSHKKDARLIWVNASQCPLLDFF